MEKEPNIAIFICLCVEILATMIRRNNIIKGISIGETEHKISQYADNTEMMLEGDEKSFEIIVKTTDTFGNKSGFFSNVGKTSAVWPGSKRDSLI